MKDKYKNKKNNINNNNNTNTTNTNTNTIHPVSSELSKKICFKCLQEKETIKIPLHPLGYHSFFDNWGTEIHLCQDCIDKCIDPSIWDASSGTLQITKKIIPEKNIQHTVYLHENEIVNYINQLPIQSQELVYNRFSWGASIISMSPQDWIDYHSGILSHEDSKKYGLISLDELKAYHKRFPACKHVRIFTELNEPIYSSCYFNCKGDKDGKCLETSPPFIPCYNCQFFQEKEQGVNTFLYINKNNTFNITVSKDELNAYFNNK